MSRTETDSAGGIRSYVPEERMARLAIGSALVGAVAALLPWYSILGQTILGIDTDFGLFALVIGLVVVGLVAFRDWDELTVIGTAVAGGIVVVLGISHLNRLSGLLVYLTLFAGVGMLVAGVQGYRKQNASP